MPQPPAKVNRGHNSRREKVVKSEIKPSLYFMVPELVYKFQMIFFRGTKVIELKTNAGHMD